MKRILSVAIGITASVIALGAMAAVAGPIVYRGVEASPNTRVPSVLPTVRDDSPEISTDSISQLSGEWDIADGSTAGYSVEATVNGSALPVTGTTRKVDGSATVRDAVLQRATIVVDVASITTDNATRDEYFRGPALDTDDYPTASFTLSSPVALSDQLLDGNPVTVAASGVLSLHGVTRDVDVSLTAELEDGSLVLSGSVPISFDDYDIAAIDLGFVTVADAGSINFMLAVEPR
jgi:polyisoprenoid-binding protein YceI